MDIADNQLNWPDETINEVTPPYNVSKLTDLALKNLIVIVLDKFYQNSDEETIDSLVNHYQPTRELIHKINQFDNYERICDKIFKKVPVERRKKIDSAIFLLWRCFENFEAKQLGLDRLFVYENKILDVKEDGKKFFAVINSQDMYLNCECLSLKTITLPDFPYNSMFDFRSRLLKENGVSESTLEHPLDQIGEFFEKIPNLKDISIFICAEVEGLCSKLIMEILPKYPSLKRLYLSLHHVEDSQSFCTLAQKHLRNLEILDMGFYHEMQVTTLKDILKSLKHLPKLSTFKPFTVHPFIWPEESLDSHNVSENDKIQHVKQIELSSPTLEELRSFHNWFTNLRSLVITFYTFPETAIHWSNEALSTLNLQHFKNIQHLEFTSTAFWGEPFQINIPLLLKQFPSLKIFVTSNFECNDTHNLLESKTLQKLIITEGKVDPPKLLKKFPNLIYFRMKWPINPSKKIEVINAVKLFLPPHCKLFKVVRVFVW